MIDMKYTLQRIKQEILQKHMDKTTLAFASTDNTIGQSTFVANLGILFARDGFKTLLIDANYEHNLLSQAFNMNGNLPGLYDFFGTTDGYQGYVHTVDTSKKLDVLVAGHPSPDKLENRLVQADFSNLLAQVSDKYDYVFINLRPIAEVKDALPVIKLAEGTILTCEIGATSKSKMYGLIKNLVINECDVLGYVSIERVNP